MGGTVKPGAHAQPHCGIDQCLTQERWPCVAPEGFGGSLQCPGVSREIRGVVAVDSDPTVQCRILEVPG